MAFDLVGTLLLALALGAYALAMTVGRGSFGLLNLALLSAAFAGFILFALAQSRARSPLLEPSMFRDPALSAALAMSVLVSTVIMATLVVGPFYLSRALGLDAARVGLVMSAGPLVAALAGVVAGRIVDRFGAQRMAVAGLIGMSAGLLALSVLPGRYGVAGYLGAIALVTAHYALFQAANNTALLAEVSADRRGVVSGMLGLSRHLGLITGASVMGAVFAWGTAASDLTTAAPASVAAGMKATFIVASLLVLAALAIAATSRAHRNRSSLVGVSS